MRSCKLLHDMRTHNEAMQNDDDINSRLRLSEGDTLWLMRRTRKAEVGASPPLRLLYLDRYPQGGSTPLGRLRLSLASRAQELGDLNLPTSPYFLWVTEFPLFTRADEDKEFLAKGRWGSSHHPFTAPMWQDIEKMYAGQIDEV